MKVYEETPQYINEYFDSEDFQHSGGNIMSLTFYLAATAKLINIPFFEKLTTWTMDWKDGRVEQIKGPRALIHDYGCAEGDGTAMLQAVFPMSKVVGYDISASAIKRARKRWPTLQFRMGDVKDPKDDADVIYTSHTIEHMEDPVSVIMNLREKCQLLVVVVPSIEGDQDGGHTGAMNTTKMFDQLKTNLNSDLVGTLSYSTLRYDPWNDGALPEGNNLLVINGLRSTSITT